jgi:hypothetical protein
MSIFAADLEEAAGAESIEKVVIGPFGWDGYDEKPEFSIPDHLLGVPLDWAVAKPLLTYEYSTGYGAPGCHAVYAYTNRHVLIVVQYDGSTSITAIPRNPEPGMPTMPGG